ncbi:MAG: molybdopterin dinucleotide binding domain-containing protein, partial [Chloroflexota bacterium]
ADLKFNTPSGKIELFSQQMADQGLDPIPTYRPAFDPAGLSEGDSNEGGPFPSDMALSLVSGAGQHFISSTFGNLDKHASLSGTPFVEINLLDAEKRGIVDGETVILKNGRGELPLRAVVTDGVREGVVVSPKGYWANKNNGRNINWLISDALADLGNQATFHSCRVWLEKES